jgi:hypothetical protein
MIPAPAPSKLLTLVVVLLALAGAALILNSPAPSAPEKSPDSEHTQDPQFFADTDRDPVLGLQRGNKAGHQARRIPVVVLRLRAPDPR